jgi:hypothetical protein
MKKLCRFGAVLTLAAAAAIAVHAQEEGPQPTQALVAVDAKSAPPANAAALTVAVNDHKESLTDWRPVSASNTQVAVLIDSGLRESIGRELDSIRDFVLNLPPGIEVQVGYMQFGHVVSEQTFTTDHAAAAHGIRLPEGEPGMSASPYLCLSDFVIHWPGGGSSSFALGAAPRKARFVLMITDGVDPYNGSTSITNQDSPYVDAAVEDAQRAGVVVYGLYFGDAGIRGASADNSGQSYLSDLAQRTGGVNLWEGVGNPVSTAPFLKRFQASLAETYVATFPAPAARDVHRALIRVKFSAPKTKLHAPDEVRPGNQE